MYHIPMAGGVAAASGAGAMALPNSGDGVVNGAHQALAFTGLAFGGYVVFALILIVAGLVLRTLAARTPKSS